jgi:amidase
MVNSKINAVVVVREEEALAAADRADEAVKRGDELGMLHGVPVTIKEAQDQIGYATTNGIVALKDAIAKSDAPGVAAWRNAGAIMIGRTNTPSFNKRWHTDNDLRGATKNPWNPNRTPGGSSGGAAAALAAGIAPLAYGGDLGGSVRFPAYCCGVAGIRSTPGRVPSFNPSEPVERPFGIQFTTVPGPLARRVADVRVGLQAMMASSPLDPLYVPVPFEGPSIAGPIKVALITDPAGLGTHRCRLHRRRSRANRDSFGSRMLQGDRHERNASQGSPHHAQAG